jgi:hypothetical protein
VEHDDPDIPKHVERYLLRVAISNIPESVLDTLKEMTPEELEVIDRLRVSLEKAEPPHYAYVFAFH